MEKSVILFFLVFIILTGFIMFNPVNNSIAKQVQVIEAYNEGNISMNNLEINGNLTGNMIYGEMYYHNDTGTTLDFLVQDTYYNLFAVPDGEYNNGFIVQAGFEEVSNLTAQVSGIYKIIGSAKGSGENNAVYNLAIFVNNVIVDKCLIFKKMSAGGDIVPMNLHCFYELNVGDVVDLRIADITGTGSGFYYGMNLNLLRVGN